MSIFDDDLELIDAVLLLAEMPTTPELPGGHVADPDLDQLIMAARVIQQREGFSVERPAPLSSHQSNTGE